MFTVMIKPLKHKETPFLKLKFFLFYIVYVTVKKRICKSIIWRIP